MSRRRAISSQKRPHHQLIAKLDLRYLFVIVLISIQFGNHVNVNPFTIYTSIDILKNSLRIV